MTRRLIRLLCAGVQLVAAAGCGGTVTPTTGENVGAPVARTPIPLRRVGPDG